MFLIFSIGDYIIELHCYMISLLVFADIYCKRDRSNHFFYILTIAVLVKVESVESKSPFTPSASTSVTHRGSILSASTPVDGRRRAWCECAGFLHVLHIGVDARRRR